MKIKILSVIFLLFPGFAWAGSNWDSLVWDTDSWGSADIAIPTLTEWGMVILIILISLSSILTLRKKEREKMQLVINIHKKDIMFLLVGLAIFGGVLLFLQVL